MTLAVAKTAAKSSGSTEFLLIIVVLILVFYFLIIRPQRNRTRKVQQQQSNVAPGARVRTTAGMYATVIGVDGNDVVLEVAPGVEVRYLRRAIMEVLPDESGEDAVPDEAEADESMPYDQGETTPEDSGDSDDSHTAEDEKTSRSV